MNQEVVVSDLEFAQFGWPESLVNSDLAINNINKFDMSRPSFEKDKSDESNIIAIDTNESVCLFIFFVILLYCLVEELFELLMIENLVKTLFNNLIIKVKFYSNRLN